MACLSSIASSRQSYKSSCTQTSVNNESGFVQEAFVFVGTAFTWSRHWYEDKDCLKFKKADFKEGSLLSRKPSNNKLHPLGTELFEYEVLDKNSGKKLKKTGLIHMDKTKVRVSPEVQGDHELLNIFEYVHTP